MNSLPYIYSWYCHINVFLSGCLKSTMNTTYCKSRCDCSSWNIIKYHCYCYYYWREQLFGWVYIMDQTPLPCTQCSTLNQVHLISNLCALDPVLWYQIPSSRLSPNRKLRFYPLAEKWTKPEAVWCAVTTTIWRLCKITSIPPKNNGSTEGGEWGVQHKNVTSWCRQGRLSYAYVWETCKWVQ